MCNTHEPPTSIEVPVESETQEPEPPSSLPHSPDRGNTNAKDLVGDAAATEYVAGIKRGDLCAFMLGYFDFLPETNVSVQSVLQFMPGMRVTIVTDRRDFSVFNR